MSSRALFAAVLALLPACDRVFGLDRPPPGVDAPEPPDAPGIDAQMCFGSGALTLCLINPAGAPLVAAAGLTTMIDTDSLLACAPYMGNQEDLCVVAAERITIDGKLRAIGTKPLVLVTPGTITISATGMIDLTGDSTVPAAGSQPLVCGDPSTAMMSGGGAGGSFGGRGGNGGSGNGGVGGTATAAVTPSILRGGCKGRAGANIGAKSGFGGGALAIFAGVEIEIFGPLNASGSHGAGGAGNSNPGRGAGGGGSGGMILLDAPRIEPPQAQIFANGGGGGEGGGDPFGGNDGTDPTAWNAVAAGGSGNSSGGDGGAGSVGTTAAVNGQGSGSTSGGGGGGGGAGVIRIVSPAGTTGPFSPPPS